MRASGLVVVLLAGCQFSVIGTPVGGAAADPGATPSSPADSTTQPQSPPTTSTPPPTNNDPDLALPPGTDMSLKRVGTPCTSDAQCDPGLFCAKTFYINFTKIDVPGGYCTVGCANDPSVCPASSICYNFSFGKYCASLCPPDPCRKGYQCCGDGTADDQKACTPDMLCKG